MNIIFLDTETTGLDPEARLVQLAYKKPGGDPGVDLLFHPPVEISIGSMATHHITSEMVADKETFTASPAKITLENILATHILVAHNAPYDINILKNEGVQIEQYIDTLSVARHLIDSPEYKLQYLRYFLKMNITEEVNAHDAWGDIVVLEQLFFYLVELAKQKYELSQDTEILDKMIELTNLPVLMKEFTFGKYRGTAFSVVSENDPGYISWLYNSELQKSIHDQNRDLLFTLKNYLRP